MDAIFLNSCVPSNDSSSNIRVLGPYQVAWYLRKHNYSVQVIDFIFKFTEEQTLDLIFKHITPETKILGVGLMILLDNPSVKSTVDKIANVLRKVKKEYPNIKLVVGGASSPFWSRHFRNGSLFDYVITGYAENTTLALCNYLYRNGQHPRFDLINGNKTIKEEFIQGLEVQHTIENSNHIWHKRDAIQQGETLPLELSRGCIFKCKFCSYPHIGKNKKDFNRNMECVKEELIHNYENFRVTNYYMIDDTFNADHGRMVEFANMVRTLPFKINYVTYLRLDLIHAHPETEDILLESGLLGAQIGIETFNQKASDLIGKSWLAKNSKEYLPKLLFDKWKNKVAVRTSMITGIPPETFEECKQSNKWMIENKIGSWSWLPLYISRDAHNPYRSEFDMDATKFNFQWEVKEGRVMWKTDYCNELEAREWKNHLTNEAKPYQHMAAWELFELGNYGYEINLVKDVKVLDLPWSDIKLKRTNWVKNYYKDIKNMND